MLADVAQNPAFQDEELERARQETLDGLTVSLRQPGTVGRYAMARRLFGKHFQRVRIENEATEPWRMNLKTGSLDYLGKVLLQWINWPLTLLFNRFGDRMTIAAYKSASPHR